MVSHTTSDRLLRRLAREQTDRRLPSAVAGVVRDGQLVWSGARGRVNGAAPDEHVQYRCGSITKTFVAVCVMQLRDQGALALSDRLDRFVPGTGVGQVTIGQLLSHSSGLRAETAGPWWERTPGGDFDALAASSLPAGTRFDAARRYHYSNVGYGLLGEVLTAHHQQPWDQVVRRQLLEPLGMVRTTTRPAPPAAPGLAVHPWADVVQAEPEHDAVAMGPAGQLWTTVVDLARWAAFLTGAPAPKRPTLSTDDTATPVLAAATLAEMREPRVINDVDDKPWTSAYGLGLQVWNRGGTRTFGHGGSMPGFQAFLEVTEHGDAVVGFANATTGLRSELGTDLLRILDETEPRLPEEWTPAAPPPGAFELVGPWYWGPSPYVVIAGRLFVELRGLGGPGRASRFRPTGVDGWVGLDGYHTGEPLTVVRQADGIVDHLDLGSFVFTRTPYDPGASIPGGVDPGGWTPAG
jgi:CubicO group peptidase (beta-lactamase class C family)